jgi:hypothetical protein
MFNMHKFKLRFREPVLLALPYQATPPPSKVHC